MGNAIILEYLMVQALVCGRLEYLITQAFGRINFGIPFHFINKKRHGMAWSVAPKHLGSGLLYEERRSREKVVKN